MGCWGPYLPLDQNRRGGVRRHRDRARRLSRNCNTRKKARIRRLCLCPAAAWGTALSRPSQEAGPGPAPESQGKLASQHPAPLFPGDALPPPASLCPGDKEPNPGRAITAHVPDLPPQADPQDRHASLGLSTGSCSHQRRCPQSPCASQISPGASPPPEGEHQCFEVLRSERLLNRMSDQARPRCPWL